MWLFCLYYSQLLALDRYGKFVLLPMTAKTFTWVWWAFALFFLSSLHSWKAKTIPVSFSLGFWVPSFRIRQWQKNCCNHAIISTSLHAPVMLQAISEDFSKKNCEGLCYMIWIMPSVSAIFYPHMHRHSKMCYLLHFPLRLSLQQHQQFCPKVRERSDYSVAVFYLTQ